MTSTLRLKSDEVGSMVERSGISFRFLQFRFFLMHDTPVFGADVMVSLRSGSAQP
jgi:hypothetical protein